MVLSVTVQLQMHFQVVIWYYANLHVDSLDSQS